MIKYLISFFYFIFVWILSKHLKIMITKWTSKRLNKTKINTFMLFFFLFLKKIQTTHTVHVRSDVPRLGGLIDSRDLQ